MVIELIKESYNDSYGSRISSRDRDDRKYGGSRSTRNNRDNRDNRANSDNSSNRDYHAKHGGYGGNMQNDPNVHQRSPRRDSRQQHSRQSKRNKRARQNRGRNQECKQTVMNINNDNSDQTIGSIQTREHMKKFDVSECAYSTLVTRYNGDSSGLSGALTLNFSLSLQNSKAKRVLLIFDKYESISKHTVIFHQLIKIPILLNQSNDFDKMLVFNLEKYSKNNLICTKNTDSLFGIPCLVVLVVVMINSHAYDETNNDTNQNQLNQVKHGCLITINHYCYGMDTSLFLIQPNVEIYKYCLKW